MLTCNDDIHKTFEIRPDLTTELAALEYQKNPHILIMGKMALLRFEWILFIFAGNEGIMSLKFVQI